MVYEKSPEGKLLQALEEKSSRRFLHEKLQDAVDNALRTGNLEGILRVTESETFGESFKIIFATSREDYEAWYKDDETEIRSIYHYELPKEIRRKTLDLCKTLQPEIANTVAGEIFNQVYEDYPKHKAGYSPVEKFEVLKVMADRGSNEALRYIAILAKRQYLPEAKKYFSE